MRTLILLLSALALGAQTTKTSRPLAPWPPAPGPIRIIIDTDAATEIDDQYAIAAALGNRDRLKIEAFIGAHFGDQGGAGAIGKSVDELHRLLKLAGLSGQIPVYPGADPIPYRDRPTTSEGVEFLIRTALSATPENPLWVLMLGPATDGVAALLREPRIAGRVVMMWHGRTMWPVKCFNFNAYNDIRAARLLFELPVPFVLFDTGTYLRISMDDSKRRFSSLGPLGRYIYDIREQRPQYHTYAKGIFDLGDIAALVDPGSARWERVQAPYVEQDLLYNFLRPQGEIVRIYHVESDRSFEILEQALRRLAPR